MPPTGFVVNSNECKTSFVTAKEVGRSLNQRGVRLQLEIVACSEIISRKNHHPVPRHDFALARELQQEAFFR